MTGLALPLLLAGLHAPQEDSLELAAPPPSFEIEVVDEAGRRLHNAGLRWIRGDDGSHGPRAPDDVASGLSRGDLALPRDVDRRLRDRPLVLAPSGRASIPGPTAPGTLVAGEHEGRWGFRWFAAGDELDGGPAQLVLVPDRDLRVVVQDDVGRPLDEAAVSVVVHPRNPGCEARDGELVLEHASWWLHRSHEHARVVLRGLFDPPVEARLDPRGPIPEPLVLRAPAHGAVVVTLTEPDGLPPRISQSVSLSLVDEDVHDRVRRNAPSVNALASGGVARFPLVQLGRRLVVEVRGEKHVIDGPRLPGETVTAALQLAPRRRAGLRPAPLALPDGGAAQGRAAPAGGARGLNARSPRIRAEAVGSGLPCSPRCSSPSWPPRAPPATPGAPTC